VSNLTRLVYVSEATRPFSTRELEELARAAADRNATRGITGLLLAGGGQFMQMLEGDPQAVAERFGVINSDARHCKVQQLVFEPAAERMFPKWWMGVINVDGLAAIDRTALLETIRLSRVLYDPTTGPRVAVTSVFRQFKGQLTTAKN
jgi:hypothetical protein